MMVLTYNSDKKSPFYTMGGPLLNPLAGKKFTSSPRLVEIYVQCRTFHVQVVLLYLEWFRRNSVLKCVLQPKIAKKSLKTPILGVQGRSRPWMLVPLESSSAVLVMMRSKSVSICNLSRARLVDSSWNRTFSRGYPNLMRSYGGLLEPRGPNLTPLKYTFNAEHFIRRLSWSILNAFGAIQS